MNTLKITENVSTAAQRDIFELQRKIGAFTDGEGSEEAFRKYRLARGVYGQRQPGVQMIRIKLPYGRVTADQLVRIADCSDEFATGNLHATTRQDIQLHFVKLSDSPQLWANLEDANITLREACGNTVRNVTASSTAGIDPDEPFDVTPYAQAIFEYFLRNPISQEMGRKFKISLSSSEKDSAFGFMHDVGLIPRLTQNAQGELVKGFKVLIGGGLGAQPFPAQVAYEFLPEDQAIPFTEALIRVFDRYGERTRRHKARMKFLLNDLGLETLLEKVQEEWIALKSKRLPVAPLAFDWQNLPERTPLSSEEIAALAAEKLAAEAMDIFPKWLATNVFEQKQKGWYGVQLRVLLGDMSSDTARALAEIVRQHAADDIRVTVNQGYLLRFVKAEDLPVLFEKLHALGLAEPGFDSTADITTCPGTDTCNLAISSSYGITRALEVMMKEEYPDLIYNNDIKIKISGCMNGCGQHSAANIGFHGSSIKNGKLVLPALQVLLGGGFTGVSEGQIGDKVIKLPSKRGPEAMRYLLSDYQTNAFEGEYFNQYYARQTKNYFYQLLKPLADLSKVQDDEYRDWDHDELFKTEVGVGECAGVMIDLVGTTLIEANEKLSLAHEMLAEGVWADGIYHAYNTFITGAKALLIGEGIATNTQYGLVKEFDTQFGKQFYTSENETPFAEVVFSINKNEPTEAFARTFVEAAGEFLAKVKEVRDKQLAETGAPALQELTFGQDS
ncbi:nitrite reductase [Arundinibacter roseus]|uniref:Nitrite reductase n=1 Tax=Arundinibacter roseus TaxID=2070510 RepID=A0A4R4K382_9BACT|nr:nitrite reductase [Arundinibacter roseus]TDB61837.1 nitrite reductase [Arundinibacter roseus]